MRYCKFCLNLNVEDELHMLCDCSLYCSIRSVMFNNVIENGPNVYQTNNEEKLTHLLMCEGKCFRFLVENCRKPFSQVVLRVELICAFHYLIKLVT